MIVPAPTPPRVLCVDDEPNVLAALTRHLGRRFAVSTATGGAMGLDLVRRGPPFHVVISDLRMPAMDGVAFLGQVRAADPDAVRILLTGNADVEAAMAAVNRGHIFRFLAKPCPPDVLSTAIDAAVEQHRLVTAERVLLEQTLSGAVKMLTDVLALVNPAAFGRATRLKQTVSELAARAGVAERWQVEVAAMLSQLGCVTLPAETVDKLYHGRALSGEERQMVDRLPAVVDELIANIPRLEEVRRILLLYPAPYTAAAGAPAAPRGKALPWGARALKLALAFDALESSGVRPAEAVALLGSELDAYDPALLEELARLRGTPATGVEELPLAAVVPGMVLAADLRSRTGVLLVARGQQVSSSLLERLTNLAGGSGVAEPVQVLAAGVPATVGA